jgi:uncharacterized FlgJ-related protein
MKKIFLILILFFSSTITSYSVNPEQEKKIREISKIALWETINSMDIYHPEIVFAQAILETGTFTSSIFKRNNNLFGMKMPSKRPTVAKKPKKKGGYAIYNDWQQSVEDYKLYQSYLFRKEKFGKTKYFNYLDKIYCQNQGYSNKLKKIIKQNKKIFNS